MSRDRRRPVVLVFHCQTRSSIIWIHSDTRAVSHFATWKTHPESTI